MNLQKTFLRKPNLNIMIRLSDELSAFDSTIRLGCLLMHVQVSTDDDPALVQERNRRLQAIQLRLELDAIHNLPAVVATRTAYKALGKDPSRYRPSAEALLRRLLQGKGLYQVNNVVDALNLVSVTSGFSIGGYDYDKISGPIALGRGRADEPYEAIGRGTLNIEGLPVLRDELGAFGSPTSDSVRTSVQTETRRFLAVFFDFTDGKILLDQAMNDLEDLLLRHAAAQSIDRQVLSLK